MSYTNDNFQQPRAKHERIMGLSDRYRFVVCLAEDWKHYINVNATDGGKEQNRLFVEERLKKITGEKAFDNLVHYPPKRKGDFPEAPLDNALKLGGYFGVTYRMDFFKNDNGRHGIAELAKWVQTPIKDQAVDGDFFRVGLQIPQSINLDMEVSLAGGTVPCFPPTMCLLTALTNPTTKLYKIFLDARNNTQAFIKMAETELESK